MCYTSIKVKVGIPESFKVGWYPLKKTGSSHLKCNKNIVIHEQLLLKKGNKQKRSRNISV